MLNIYFNYPNSAITVHEDSSCALIRSHRKQAQRLVELDRKNLSEVLQRFKERQYKFAATSAINDLWLKLDLSDSDLELAVAKHIQRQLAKQYKRFADAEIKSHC